MNTENIQKEQGTISVNTENIFPIIKRSLYSDHEIFLRELISNASDATQKIKYLASTGEFQGELGDLKIVVSVDAEAKTITVSDMGLGMTDEEVRQYINQVAFSGAEEFVKKFKDAGSATNDEIIGRFGLGFYSAFMVSENVEIVTKSYREEAACVHWTCDGSTTYTMQESERENRGTDIILHIDADSTEFLDKYRLKSILSKYFRFVSIPIELDGERINPTAPLWKKTPRDITDEEYLEFFRELYPMAEDPLFWIHLNIDYPFNLTGILYFPKIKREIAPERNKIQLYSRQVFITDEVKDIVPDYLMLLQGMIDSPDIPLNVSRSYLQSDSNVKKISSYITRKVADKLMELFEEDREKYEEKWRDISVFVKYGIITDDKFYEKAEKFTLIENTDNKLFTLEEYQNLIAAGQTDKNEDLIHLYTNDANKQDMFIKSAKDKGYDVLVMDGVLDNHFIAHLEQKRTKSRWKRVDADTVDKLIEKADAEQATLTLTEEEQTSLKNLFTEAANNPSLNFAPSTLGETQPPVIITRSEWQRRMQEMSQFSREMSMFGAMPETFNVVLNTEHPIIKRLVATPDEKLARQVLDLALLTQDMLKGKDLTAFIQRSVELM